MRVGKANGEDWLRLGEAAKALGVSLNTLRRWSDSGRLCCYRSPGGHRRYRRGDLEALLGAQWGGARQAGDGAPDVSATAANAAVVAGLSAIARVAAEGLGVDSCRFLLAGSAGELIVAGGYRHDDDGPGRSWIAEQVLEIGRRVVIADVETSGLLPAGAADDYRRRGQRALLALPLPSEGGPAGVLELAAVGPRTFTGANVSFAEFLAREAAALLDPPQTGQAVATGSPLPPGDSFAAQAATARVARLGDRAEGPTADTPLSDAEALVHATLEVFTGQHGVRACVIYRLTEGVLTPVTWSAPEGDPRPQQQRVADLPEAVQALEWGRTVYVAPEDDGAAAAHFLHGRGCGEALFRPLTFARHTVGLLEADAAEAGPLKHWIPIIEVLADDLAAILGSGDVIDRLERRNRDLALVIDGGLQDTAPLSSEEMLHAVVRRLSELTAAPVADLYKVEGDTLRALVSYDGGRFDEEWEGTVIPLPRYPCSRRAVESGEITIAASLQDPLLDADGRHSLEKWGYQSQLTLPLVSAGRVLGVVELSDYVPRDFAAVLELVRGLGQVAAHALENAALLEQVERRNRILNELVELGAWASDSHDTDGLLRRTAERLLAGVDVANCDIFRSDGDELRCVVSYDRSGFDDLSVGSLLDPHDYPTLIRAMNDHQVLVVDGYDDPQLTRRERDIFRDFGFASEVCIPLVANDRLYGVLDLYDTRRRDYTEYMSFLCSAGQTLAGALESSTLLGQLEQRTTVLREIVDLGAMAAQTRDLQELLHAIAARLRDTVQAADCDIFTLRGDQLRCQVSADLDGFDESVVGELLDMSRFTATAMAVQAREPMAIGGLDDPRLTHHERANYREYGFQSELCIPLMMGDQVIGLIDLFDTQPRDFAAFIDYLRAAGQIVAGAIRNALLAEELEETALRP